MRFGYPQGVDTSENMQRHKLLIELEQLRHDMEFSGIPQVIESMLSLRLTMQQVKVLSIVVVEPTSSSIRQLADILDVSLATMSGIVERLETQDMVERVADPEDQRVRRVVATALGRETIRKLVSSHRELEQTHLERLTLDDLAALVQGVRAIAETMRTPE